jgi:glycosyltransferase involved in cell wall biosynthesis
MPAYDAVFELERCLHSLSVQTYPVDQVVVVDDTSPLAGQVEVTAKRYGAWYIHADYGRNRFRKTQAYNIGAYVLDTDIVLFSQADLLFPVDYIERHVRLHEAWRNLVAHPNVFHFGHPDMMYPDLTFAHGRDHSSEHVAPFRDQVVFSTEDDVQLTNGVGTGSICSLRRENLMPWETKFISTAFGDDDYYNRCCCAGLFPAVFEDLEVLHVHRTERDVSFFDEGYEEAQAYYDQKRESFHPRQEPVLEAV